MYDKPIEYQTQTKYLGVIFDTKLSFRPHINNKFNKAKKLLFASKNAMGKLWGPKPNLTKWLYTNIVRPTFTYGCIAWAKMIRTKEFQTKAKRLQRLALCDIGPIRTHSPTSGLEIFTNVIPLDLYIKGEFIAAHNRVKKVITTIAGTCDTLSSHYAWARKLRDEAGLHNIPSDSIIPYFHGFKKYTCSAEQYNEYNEANQTKIQIYTDGSRMKINNELSYTGCGYIIYGPNQETIFEQSSYLGTMTSVFQAEIFAIGQAAHYMCNNKELGKGINQVDIITDSKSALNALNGITTTSKLVKDCMTELDNLQSMYKVKIHWIKAHVGHPGNEKADELAKQGTKKTSHVVEPILPVSKSWISRKIKEYITTEWTSRWRGIPEARQTKIFLPKPNAKTSKKLLSYDKQTCAKLFRWISGHSFHRYHNYLLQPDTYTDPTCRACMSEKEETSHLFAHCEGLMDIRMRIIGKQTLPEDFTWTPNQLLTMAHAIDKICPEEGTSIMIVQDIGTQAPINNSINE
jgi:ribonuclease HI